MISYRIELALFALVLLGAAVVQLLAFAKFFGVI